MKSERNKARGKGECPNPGDPGMDIKTTKIVTMMYNIQYNSGTCINLNKPLLSPQNI